MPLATPTIQPATLLSTTSYPVPDKLLIAEHFLTVPLSHNNPNGRRLRLFCRTAEPSETALSPTTLLHNAQTPPLIAYINGGPGFGNPHPKDMPCTATLLAKGYKLICLDHRGMGLSNTITKATLAREGDAAAQAEYLTHFRAPYAVQDLEAVRLCLVEKWCYPQEKRKWSVMGQSYGGFVCTTYLSMYPDGLREVFVFGGLPPVLERRPDETVRRCVAKLRERNERFYGKFPGMWRPVGGVVDYLRENEVSLRDGGVLTPARWLELGIGFGMHGGLDDVHGKVVRAVNDLETFGELTRPTVDGISGYLGFDGAVLEPKAKYLFTGEMVFSRAYNDYGELQGLKEIADILHAKSDWDDLYDIERLKQNDVPVYAAVYVDDLYVPMDLSLLTADIIKGCKTFITNQLYHNAIRSKSEDVLKTLFALRDDTLD